MLHLLYEVKTQSNSNQVELWVSQVAESKEVQRVYEQHEAIPDGNHSASGDGKEQASKRQPRFSNIPSNAQPSYMIKARKMLSMTN